MKTEHALLISKTVFVVGVLMFLLGLVGELLGWWNDVGEILMQVGTGAGAFGGLATVVVGSSSDEVQAVHEAVEDNGRTLDSVDDKLDGVDDKLGSVDGKLDEQTDELGKLDKLDKLDDLDVIKDALLAQDGQVSKLDVVQTELDRQTGVLGRQLDVLGEIRDRL